MNVFVSITTTKKRLGLFYYSLLSLKKQTYNNFQIIINISKEPYLFDDGIRNIPNWMAGEKIKINYVKNTGSFRKLIPAINNVNKNDIVVTADDDIIYPDDWLKCIVRIAEKYPDLLVCSRARLIKKNIFGVCQSYNNWPLCTKSETGIAFLPGGGGGVAYRPYLLDLNFLNNQSYLKDMPTSDDIWFRIASIRNKTKVHVVPEIDKKNIYMMHQYGLWEINKTAPRKKLIKIRGYFGSSLSQNDLAWKKALKYLPAESVL